MYQHTYTVSLKYVTVSVKAAIYLSDLSHLLSWSGYHSHVLYLFLRTLHFLTVFSVISTPVLSFSGWTTTIVLTCLWGSNVYRAFIYIWYYRCRWSVDLSWMTLAFNAEFRCRWKKLKLWKNKKQVFRAKILVFLGCFGFLFCYYPTLHFTISACP